MFETFRNAWKIEDLRKKLLYTLLVIVIFRLGCAIPVPFIAPEALQGWVAGQSGSMLGYIDMLTGGSFSRATLFALSVTPYINASIIIQLLTVAIPALERLSKEGEDGRKKLTRITRYTGAGIALALGIGYYFLLRGQGALVYGSGAQMFAQVFSAIVVILAFTAGSLLIQWLGEQIDVKGIGNGISILIFAGIVSRWTSIFTTIKTWLGLAAGGEVKYYFLIPVLVVLAVAVVVFIVILNAAERRIPVQYAKRVVGRKMYGGQSTHIPHQGEHERRYAGHLRQCAGLHPGYHRRVLPEPVQCGGPSVCRSVPADVQHHRLGVCSDLSAAHHCVQLFLCGDAV